MTLTQSAIWTKRGIIGIIASMILGISASVGYNAWYQYQLAHRPPVEEKPEMKFGTLPSLQFPPSTVSSSNFSYSIDTVTGGLPQTPKLLKVYFIPQAGISLLSSERAQKLANSLGFTSDPKILSNTNYKYTDENGGNLTIDLTTGNFHLERPTVNNIVKSDSAATESAKQKNTSYSDKDQPVTDFKSYLATKNLLINELNNTRTNTTFNGASLNESDTIQVSLWPSDIDNLPVATAAFKHGLVKANIDTSADYEDRFSTVDYTFWLIDKTTFSTYPLKSMEQAYADLRAGLGFVSIEPPSPKVSISSVYLAYYEPGEYSQYLQPVFVFEGSGFAALVPAIVRAE